MGTMHRKEFLDRIINLFLTVFAALVSMNIYTALRKRFRTVRTIEIPIKDLQKPWHMEMECVISSQSDNLKVYSRHCPHLGCILQIHSSENAISCPCHGSRFDLQGTYVSGPAKQNMKILNYEISEDNKLRIFL